MADEPQYIASVDFGTTSVRCFLYDLEGNVKSHATEHVTKLYPHQGWCEIEPEEIWNKFLSVVKRTLGDVNANAKDVKAFGLATQRGSFVTWDKRTGEPYHNLITCNDMRADYLVDQLNNTIRMKMYRQWFSLAKSLSKKNRYATGSTFNFINGMVCLRLRWMLEHNENLRNDVVKGFAAMGTLDSFLLHRLTLGQLHATDYSNACVTGIFDPYKLRWIDRLISDLGIARSLLPEVRDSAGDWGDIHASIFGCEIPIRCVVSDRGASIFGSFCFDEGDVHLSMGAGTLLAVNNGSNPRPSAPGLYPTIGWKMDSDVAYLTESYSSDTATVIDWCHKMSLFQDYDDISNMASSVDDNERVFFVPPSGGMENEEETAAAGFVGLLPSTRKEHLLRSALECLAFRVFQMCHQMAIETGTPKKIRVDGKVARNDFLMQLIADLTNVTIERPTSVETTAHGTAYLAGLAAGFWNSRNELRRFYKIDRVFEPNEKRWSDYQSLHASWKKAVQRLSNWY